MQGNKAGSLLRVEGEAALTLLRDFANRVDRVAWRAAAFTSDSEHVIAAAGPASGQSSSSSGERSCLLWCHVHMVCIHHSSGV